MRDWRAARAVITAGAAMMMRRLAGSRVLLFYIYSSPCPNYASLAPSIHPPSIEDGGVDGTVTANGAVTASVRGSVAVEALCVEGALRSAMNWSASVSANVAQFLWVGEEGGGAEDGGGGEGREVGGRRGRGGWAVKPVYQSINLHLCAR